MITKDSHTWEFVEQYYPNYYSCEWIKKEGDLYKLITGEYEENEADSAYQLLQEEYNGDINSDEKMCNDWDRLQSMIYEKAIQGYINSVI